MTIRFSRNILRIAWSNVYGLVALLKSSFEYARLHFFKIKVRHCYMDHSANRPRRNYTRLPGAMHCLGSNCVIDSTNASFANNSAIGNGGKTRRRAQVCTGNSVRKLRLWGRIPPPGERRMQAVRVFENFLPTNYNNIFGSDL